MAEELKGSASHEKSLSSSKISHFQMHLEKYFPEKRQSGSQRHLQRIQASLQRIRGLGMPSEQTFAKNSLEQTFEM